MKITLSELYGCIPDEDVLRLMDEYSKMLGWWAEKAQGFEGGPYAKFRNTYYAAWKERWPDWNSQHAQTSSMFVYSTIHLSRRKPGGPRRLELRVQFAVLSPRVVKVEHGLLRVSTTIRDFGYVKLILNNSYQQKLLKQAEEKLWQLGQVMLTLKWAIIPFIKDLDITVKRHLELEALLKTS